MKGSAPAARSCFWFSGDAQRLEPQHKFHTDCNAAGEGFGPLAGPYSTCYGGSVGFECWVFQFHHRDCSLSPASPVRPFSRCYSVKTGGPHRSGVVSSWGVGKSCFPHHQGKKEMWVNFSQAVFCTDVSYCVLSMALKLERKINPKV